MEKGKRGLSPVIATVLLIAIVVVLALIVFFWFRSITEETILKFDQNIRLVCKDVSFDAEYLSGAFSITNSGNVPIYSMQVKLTNEDGYTTEDLDMRNGLNEGNSGEYTFDATGYSEAKLIPVLLGSTDNGEKTRVCEEGYGKDISI